MDTDSVQSPEPGWRSFHPYHWDDNDGWLEVPIGRYCRLCNAVISSPEPIIVVDDEVALLFRDLDPGNW